MRKADSFFSDKADYSDIDNYFDDIKYLFINEYGDMMVVENGNINLVHDKYHEDVFYAVKSYKKLFLSANSTRFHPGIRISEVYCFSGPAACVLFVTNHGDFVYYKDRSNEVFEPNEYIIPVDKFTEMGKELASCRYALYYPLNLIDPSEFLFGKIEFYLVMEHLYDMSEYEVKPFENLYLPMIVIGVLIVGMAVTITVLVVKQKKKKQPLPVDDEQSPDEN